MESTVADHAAFAPVEVQHGREREVDAAGAQFAAQHIAGGRRRIHGIQRTAAFALLGALPVIHPHAAEGAHGRQVGEAVAAKALHAPAFVVHADQQVFAHRLDLGRERQQLGTVLPVAREQYHAADQRVREALAVRRRECCARDVDDEGSVLHGRDRRR